MSKLIFFPNDQELQEALASDPDPLKQRLGKLSQKVTILKVNERALTRQYMLVQLSESSLRKVKFRRLARVSYKIFPWKGGKGMIFDLWEVKGHL